MDRRRSGSSVLRCDRCLDPVTRITLTKVGAMAICPTCLVLDKMIAPWQRYAGKATCIEGFVIVEIPRLALHYFRAHERYHPERVDG
jgi:hypothetical protein